MLGFDFVVIDQEHAPIDRSRHRRHGAGCARVQHRRHRARRRSGRAPTSSRCSTAARPASSVPHVDSAGKARDSRVPACRYRGGRRGFANTTRAGSFGEVSFPDHMAAQDSQVACIAMIEDVAALDRIDAIAAVEGIDAFFIGRGDLTAAHRRSLDDLAGNARRSSSRSWRRRAGPACRSSCCRPTASDAIAMAKLGATAFIVSSDHGFLKQAARQALAEFSPPHRRSVDEDLARTPSPHPRTAGAGDRLLARRRHQLGPQRARLLHRGRRVRRARRRRTPGREKIRAFYKWREDRGARTVVHSVHNFQAHARRRPRQGDLPLVPDALRRRRQAGPADAPADPDRAT